MQINRGAEYSNIHTHATPRFIQFNAEIGLKEQQHENSHFAFFPSFIALVAG
jgi:hypothetical protein